MFYLLVIILSVLATFLVMRNNPKEVAKLNADLAAAQNELATIKAKAASLGYKI